MRVAGGTVELARPLEAADEHRARIEAAVGRRVVLVEVGERAAHVVAEAARGRVDVEEARHLVALVPEPVGDVARDDDERPGGRLEP